MGMEEEGLRKELRRGSRGEAEGEGRNRERVSRRRVRMERRKGQRRRGWSEKGEGKEREGQDRASNCSGSQPFLRPLRVTPMSTSRPRARANSTGSALTLGSKAVLLEEVG